MQKFNAWRKRDWLIHFFFSTSSVCMIAIWPVGPPNEMNPSFSQNRNASPNDGARYRSWVALVSFILGQDKLRLWIDEFADQPGGTDAIDLRARTRHPGLTAVISS